jgi:hypothetical protein
MKIKFFSDYDSSENLLKRFYDNFDIYDDALIFTITDDYDFAVVFNNTNESLRPDAKIITVIQEPSWNEVHTNNSFLTSSDYLLIHDPELFEHKYQLNLGGKVIESPSYMFYHDRLNHHFFDNAGEVKKEKKLSMIVSGLYRSRGNYRKRIDMLMKMLESDLDLDIYGRDLNINDPRYKGELKYKASGLLTYEYSIAIENSNEKNYITEKFVDCVLCNTIPIYNGAPNITEVYDARYLRTIDIESNTIVEDIKEIINEQATVSVVNKNIYFKTYNLYTKLKEIIFN